MAISRSYLLDTNIVVQLLRNDPAVKSRLAVSPSVFVSVISLGELYFGARSSQHIAENLRQVADFALATPNLECDRATAEEYALIRNDLRAVGHMIPDNDIWIAATARQYNLILVTRDAHFQHIANLAVEAW